MEPMSFRKFECTLLAVAMAVSVGCAGEKVNLGDSKPDESEKEVHTWGASLTDYAGSWDGYAEAYSFDDSSDRIRLTIDADGTGHLVVGEAEPPPAPEAGKGYPPAPPGWAPSEPHAIYSIRYLHAGFHYTLVDASVDNNRLQMGVWPGELYQDWCPLLDSYLVADGDAGAAHYSCIPVSGAACDETGCWGDFPDGSRQLLTDAQRSCSRRCACDATGCSIDHDGFVSSIPLDGALEQDGSKLVGTLVIGEPTNSERNTRVTVRLSRVATP